MPWLCNALFARNTLRLIAVTAILFAALPAETRTPADGQKATSTYTFGDNFRRWMQPRTAEAAPQKAVRYRKRTRAARPARQRPAAEAVSAQPAPTLAPLTPFIQVWPHAVTAKPDGEILPVMAKAGSERVPFETDEKVLESDELSEIDLAAEPAQAFALADTNGQAASDMEDSAPATNRFTGFAEAVHSIGRAPWFEPVLFVLVGVIAAFSAARFFVRA